MSDLGDVLAWFCAPSSPSWPISQALPTLQAHSCHQALARPVHVGQGQRQDFIRCFEAHDRHDRAEWLLRPTWRSYREPWPTGLLGVAGGRWLPGTPGPCDFGTA